MDLVDEFKKFLKTDNSDCWLVKSSTGNRGKGITMIRDTAAYKESLLSEPDKWGTPAFSTEEVKEVLN